MFALLIVCAFVTLVLMPAESALALARVTNVSVSPYRVSRFVGAKRASVRYRLSTRSRVTVKVQTSTGGAIKTLFTSSTQSSGYHTAYWTLKKDNGAYASNGSYRFAIYIRDMSGHTGSPYPAKASFIVDNTAPSGAITGLARPTVAAKIGETQTVTFRISDNYTTTNLPTTIEILSPTGGSCRKWSATLPQGTGRTWDWDAKSSSNATAYAGAYSVRVIVKDGAGNSYTSASTPLYVNGWSEPRDVEDTPYYDVFGRSDTEEDTGITHVAWNDNVNETIMYRRLDANGNTILAPVALAQEVFDAPDYTRGLPDVAADNDGGAWVTWRGSGLSSSRQAIKLVHINASGSVDAGGNLDERGTTSVYNLMHPRVSAGPNGIAHVVCYQEGQTNAIWYATFRKDGNPSIGWTALAASSQGMRCVPNVEADATGKVHVVWYGSPVSGSSKRQLYYTRLTYGDQYTPSSVISQRQLTSRAEGYDYARTIVEQAPELSAASDGTLHVVIPDKKPGGASQGLMYLKVAPSGTVAFGPSSVFNGAQTDAAAPCYNPEMPSIYARGQAATVVFRGIGKSADQPERLWQVDIGTTGGFSKGYCVTDGDDQDLWPSAGAGPDNLGHLVYFGDSNGGLQTPQQQVMYRDLRVNADANDLARPDLEVDTAHVAQSSSPAPPRQNTLVTFACDVMNSGWQPLIGAQATLEYEGLPVDSVAVPALAAEDKATVMLQWNVPSDAVDPPLEVTLRVTPSPACAQSCVGNDATVLPVWFEEPPTSQTILVDVFDETLDDDRSGDVPVLDRVVQITGTTEGGQPYSSTGENIGYWTEFPDVPFGTYNVTATSAGHLQSDPVMTPLSITTAPGDPYDIVVTPGVVVTKWLNRWSTVGGTVVQSGTSTPISGAAVSVVGTARSTSTPSNGNYSFNHLAPGSYTVKATKAGWARKYETVDALPATVHDVDIGMDPTTNGYLVGTITDEGGYPAINDPGSSDDDPTITVRRTSDNGIQAQQTPNDGHFDITVPAGSYRLSYSAPGYVSVNDVASTVSAGVERDETQALELNVSDITHRSHPERWVVGWTLHANWFGSQPPKSPFNSYNIKGWYGMYRFKFDGDYQTVGTNTYIRSLRPWFSGEYWDETYLIGVDPPSSAPHVFASGDNDPPDEYNIGPVADRFSRNLAAVRVDQVDIVDGRDYSVVATMKHQWDSVWNPGGKQYGYSASVPYVDYPIPNYSHTVPWNDQLVRVWLRVGREEDGAYTSTSFGDIDAFNQGQLMQGSGTPFEVLYWDPSENTVWVEPAIAGYPTVP
ncbi:MAG: carboxypeptidase regulatory-like domain-containing protein [Coriobacteriales bacterium]|nr:carboxypeptidase regulatory-like domain-containing protein [Coriobacteriales bacterium]